MEKNNESKSNLGLGNDRVNSNNTALPVSDTIPDYNYLGSDNNILDKEDIDSYQ